MNITWTPVPFSFWLYAQVREKPRSSLLHTAIRIVYLEAVKNSVPTPETRLEKIIYWYIIRKIDKELATLNQMFDLGVLAYGQFIFTGDSDAVSNNSQDEDPLLDTLRSVRGDESSSVDSIIIDSTYQKVPEVLHDEL